MGGDIVVGQCFITQCVITGKLVGTGVVGGCGCDNRGVRVEEMARLEVSSVFFHHDIGTYVMVRFAVWVAFVFIVFANVVYCLDVVYPV